jgi:O-antigen ligase
MIRRLLPLAAVVVFALAVPQCYLLPEGTVDIALSTVVTILLAPVAAVWAWHDPGGRRLLRGLLVAALAGLLVVRVLAFAWSPDPGAGRLPVVLLAQFIITVVLLHGAAAEDPDLLRRIQYAYWPLVMLQALLVAVFRLSPAAENAFLHAVGGLFAGQNTVGGLFTTSRNNVLDPAKSGGVFVNANVAGLFLGASAMAAFAIWSRTRQRVVLAAGFVALAGVWLTGSKSGLMLSVVFSLAALVVYSWQLLRPIVRRYLLVAGGVAAVALIAVLAGSGGVFGGAVRDAFVQRTDIWGYGARAFTGHPLLGLGWGGWQEGFAAYAKAHRLDSQSFPPHNVLLAAWAQTGLLGLALTVLVFVAMLRLAVKYFKRDPLFTAWAGAALAWMIVQAMGENTDVFGEIHLVPVIALLLSYLAQPTRREAEHVADADIWNRETSAFPTVGNVHPQPSVDDADVPAAVHHT